MSSEERRFCAQHKEALSKTLKFINFKPAQAMRTVGECERTRVFLLDAVAEKAVLCPAQRSLIEDTEVY